MNNKEIIILVGNIGSGKTTKTKELVEKGYVIISRDSLRYMIGSGQYIFNEDLEPAIWHSELKIVKEFMLLNSNIIVDETGMTKTERARYINLAQKYDYKVVVMLFPKLSMEESVNRRMNNPHGQPDRKLWENVWKKFNQRYEEPTFEEGIHEIRRIM